MKVKIKKPTKRELTLAAELKALQKKWLKDVTHDLKQFELVGSEKASVHILAEHMAASNLGHTNRRDLDLFRMEGIDVEPEVRGWIRTMNMALLLTGKYLLEPTNENVLMLSWHPKASKQYSKRDR